MSTVSLTWGMGLIIGPAAGGLLSKPAEKYGGFDPDGLFGQFPYLLPSLVAAGIGVIGLMAMPFLPETLHFDAESCSIKEPRAAGAAAVKHKHRDDNDGDEDADVALASDVGRGTATDGARAGYDWRPLTADQDETADKPTDVVPEVDEVAAQGKKAPRWPHAHVVLCRGCVGIMAMAEPSLTSFTTPDPTSYSWSFTSLHSAWLGFTHTNPVKHLLNTLHLR